MLNLIHLQRDLNQLDPDLIDLNGGTNIDLEKSLKVLKIYERLGDIMCNLALYEPGLKYYQSQVYI